MNAPAQPLRCLLVEDSEDDAQLLLRKLREGGYAVTAERVETPEAMQAALDHGTWDLVISDFNLPRFNGLAALALLHAKGLDLPFIVVSGTIGEEIAVATMRAGAHDYVMKGNLARLAPAVARELGEASKRRILGATEAILRLQGAALETAANAIVITDRGGTIEWVNAAFTTLTGYDRFEALGRNPRDLVKSGQTDAAVYADLWRTITAGQVWHGELVNRRKDGSLYSEKQSISPVLDAAGVITHFVAIKQDLTERDNAGRALRESERFNRATLDALNAHIAVLDADGVILATNRAWREFAADNQTAWTAVTEGANYFTVCARAAAAGCAEAETILRSIRSVAAGDAPQWSFEYPCHSPTKPRWFYCTATRFPGEGPVRVVVAHEEISALKGAQAALIESESRHRLLFERNPLPMWVYDAASLAILASNDAASRSYGYSADEFRNLSFRGLHVPEEVPALLADLAKNSAADLHIRETRHRRKDGTVIHAEVFSRPLMFGGTAATLAMASDITEKKLIQEKFLHTQRLESLGMLASGIAHDLNNILAPIVFAAPLLRGSLTRPRDLKVLDTLNQCATRGTGLVKQILGFAGAASGEYQDLQLKHLLRDIIGVIEETFPKSITLVHEIPTQLWSMRGDPTQLHQVLLNLCVNARDAMPHGGTLRLTAANRQLDALEAATLPGARPGAWVVLEVADTGTGIPPAVLERIWEPFFTTKPPGKGTGLGLSTVRGIVATHHGFVTLDTAEGRGTTFRLFFPAADGEDHAAQSAPPLPLPAGRGELILVVDDDPAIRFITTEILTTRGYRALSAADGVEAMAAFNVRPHEIALVVTDVDMPNLGGGALVEALRKIRPDVCLLAMSGMSPESAGDDSEVSTLQPFVQGFLLKPFKESALIEAVHRLLCSPRSSPPSPP